MLGIQAEQLTPFDVRLLKTVCQLQRDLQRPAPSRVLANHLDIPGRTMRYYLRRLELSGLLYRPNGSKGGYQAARVQVLPLVRQHEQLWVA